MQPKSFVSAFQLLPFLLPLLEYTVYCCLRNSVIPVDASDGTSIQYTVGLELQFYEFMCRINFMASAYNILLV